MQKIVIFQMNIVQRSGIFKVISCVLTIVQEAIALLIGPPPILPFLSLPFAMAKEWWPRRRLQWRAHPAHRVFGYFHDDAQQKHYHHLSMFNVRRCPITLQHGSNVLTIRVTYCLFKSTRTIHGRRNDRKGNKYEQTNTQTKKQKQRRR